MYILIVDNYFFVIRGDKIDTYSENEFIIQNSNLHFNVTFGPQNVFIKIIRIFFTFHWLWTSSWTWT